MTRVSVARASKGLPELVRKAEAGESVVITRNGRPVVEIRAVSEDAKQQAVVATRLENNDGPAPDDHHGLAWLARRRSLRPGGGMDAATLVRMMRDEEL